MALDGGKLSNVVRVTAGSTVAIATCSSSKKVYIKSVLMHASGTGINTGAAHVYFVPNGDAVGDYTDGGYDHMIFNADVRSGETVLFEPSYPIVLDTTGDKLFVGTGEVTGLGATHMNFYITGDQEA
jgi:hypothetical protein